MTNDSQRQAGAFSEVEITREMIEAGVSYCKSTFAFSEAIVYVTKQYESAMEIERDRPVPTPAMIDAGVAAICDYEPDTGEMLRDRVVEIFLAMWSELPRSDIFLD